MTCSRPRKSIWIPFIGWLAVVGLTCAKPIFDEISTRWETVRWLPVHTCSTWWLGQGSTLRRDDAIEDSFPGATTCLAWDAPLQEFTARPSCAPLCLLAWHSARGRRNADGFGLLKDLHSLAWTECSLRQHFDVWLAWDLVPRSSPPPPPSLTWLDLVDRCLRKELRQSRYLRQQHRVCFLTTWG